MAPKPGVTPAQHSVAQAKETLRGELSSIAASHGLDAVVAKLWVAAGRPVVKWKALKTSLLERAEALSAGESSERKEKAERAPPCLARDL